MAVTAPQVRLWTREEHLKMVESGIIAPDERVELIDGEIVAMAAQGSLHASGVRLAEEALREAFGAGYEVRPQLPVSLSEHSEPEPDVAVVPGTPRDYVGAHPTTALLVVEVADVTLAFDRGRKAALYAKGGIQEYWIVNLVDRMLEVHWEAGVLAARPSEYGYRSVQRFGPSDSVLPLAAPASPVRVADLLP